MFRKTEVLCLFLLGGFLYSCLEIAWRGYTHWSMTVAGGVCLVLIHGLNRRMIALPLVVRCAAGSAVITAVEFAVGLIVNRMLDLAVWDYSTMPGNVLGQICPAFSFLWFLICIPACLLSTSSHRFFVLLARREGASV